MPDIYKKYKCAMLDALIGEIYPEIRYVAIRWKDDIGEFTIRYILDREPTDYDYESISIVSANFYAHLNAAEDKNIKKYSEQCLYHPKGAIPLDDHHEFDVLYGRREWVD